MTPADGIQVDASRCYALFRRLNTKNQRKASRAALKGAAGKLKKEATKNLQAVIGNSVTKSRSYTRTNGKTAKHSLAKGIKAVVKDENQAKVHIMGDYRLKWFEMGTQFRTTKGRRGKGKKIPMRRASERGRIFKNQSRLGWFAKAVKAKEPEAAHDIEEALIKNIQKLAKREGFTLT